MAGSGYEIDGCFSRCNIKEPPINVRASHCTAAVGRCGDGGDEIAEKILTDCQAKQGGEIWPPYSVAAKTVPSSKCSNSQLITVH